MLRKKKKEKRKLEIIQYIENLRIKNPDVYYPESLASGTIQDIITYDVKVYQKK